MPAVGKGPHRPGVQLQSTLLNACKWGTTRSMIAPLTGAGYTLTLCAAAYALIALVSRARTYRPDEHAGSASASVRQPVTVFKPLCGNEPRLGENLVTFCEQTYPEYQLLFGVPCSLLERDSSFIGSRVEETEARINRKYRNSLRSL